MRRQNQFIGMVLLALAASVHPIRAFAQKPSISIPGALAECEAIGCSLWNFQAGQATVQWPMGAVGNLTVERFDADAVSIRRVDTTGAGKGLTALYTGNRRGDAIDGAVTWSWPDHGPLSAGSTAWHATILGSRPGVTSSATSGAPPSAALVLSECEAGGCDGDWRIYGSQGTAEWKRGARADLRILELGANSITVQRNDYVGAGPGLAAVYHGVIHGTDITGEVTATWAGIGWPNDEATGPWSAKLISGSLPNPVAAAASSNADAHGSSTGASARPLKPHVETVCSDPSLAKPQPLRIADTMYKTLKADDPSLNQVNAVEAWKKGNQFAAESKFSDALFWYERAAAQGNVDAASEIGSLYQFGLGVADNGAMAAQWMEAASKAGSSIATYHLAGLYNQGKGIAKDVSRARALAEEASVCQGESSADFALYLNYSRGTEGFPRDPQAAQYWQIHGTEQLGVAKLICNLKSVKDDMSNLMAEMYKRLYTSPTSTAIMFAAAVTNTPIPEPTPSAQRRVLSVEATSRHGDAEVECLATFNAEPGLWEFKVTRVDMNAGLLYVTSASAGQWFELVSDKTNLALNGIVIPISLHDLYGLGPH